MRALLSLAAVLCVAAFPALAQADSLVYMKDGQVWLSNTDGSGARQFTLYAYNWHSPSEADDGTVVAAGGPVHGSYGDPGTDLYRFKGDGNQIGGAIPTPGSYSTLDCLTYAPTDVEVSPDASKIAYSSFLCGSQEYTAYWTPATATGLDFPNQTLGQENYRQPSWIDSSHFTVSHVGVTVTSSQARWFAHDVSAGDDVGPGWNEDTMNGTGAQGIIARNGQTFAVFEDDAADHLDGLPTYVHIWIYTATSLATAETSGWTKQCEIALDASKTTHPLKLSPSFSPDGTKLLWADDTGVEVASIADMTSNCASTHPVLIVPGASEPYYSKGNLQAPASNPTQPGAPAPTNNDGGGSSPTGTQPPTTSQTQTVTPPATSIQKLIARFVVKTKHPRAKHRVAFDASSSKPAGSKIVSFSWNFGDKKKAKGRTVTHVFKKRGKYKVTLVIKDAAGHTAKVTRVVKIA